MAKDGNILTSLKPSLWDVIIMDNEITLYSNGLYLGIDEDNENVIGVNYSFFNEKSKLFLSVEGSWIRANKNKIGLFELFRLIEKDNH